MDAPSPRSRIGGSRTGQILATRRGALSIAALAAILAAVLLYLFVQHYKTNNTVAAAPTNIYVFVAGQYIPQGTPAQTVAAEGLLRRTEVASTQAVAGAISDPSAITGEVAVNSIAAGQQITAADFTHANITVGAYLKGDQRAIAIPLDPPHGLTSYLAQGDTVDLLTEANGVTTVLAQNVTVLGNQTGDVVLRVSDKQSLAVSAASDTQKVWLVLRPPVDAQQSVGTGTKGGA